MKRFLAGFGAGVVVVLAAATLAGWLLWERHWHEIYWEWTVFEMPPACQEYEDPFKTGDQDFYPQIDGEPTAEFWQHAIKELEKYPDIDTQRTTSVSVRQGKIYVSLREFFKSSQWLGDLDKGIDPDKNFFFVSDFAAREIYRDRISKGIITEETLKPFHVMQRIRKYKRPPHPDECGFMEELILKGGRFASE